MWKSLKLFYLLLLVILPVGRSFAAADEETRCIVCNKVIKFGTYYKYQHPTLKKEVFICADCKELKQHCSKCGLPVFETAEKIEDGRYFCPIDFPLVALDDKEIRRMFANAATELDRMSNGKMRLQNTTVTVNVFDVDYWNSKIGEKDQPSMQRHGLSTSRPVGDKLIHTVLLHRGLWKDEMVAVCAHEFTHLWINENKPKGRMIEPQTIEAVCEVVALALMEHLQMPGQVKEIMENTYTQGRIKPAAEFYHVHGLNRVLDWVVEGKQTTFNEQDFQVAYSSPSAAASWRAPGKAYRQEFDALHLKSVIGTKEKSVALINDKTFVKGEERQMEVSGKKLLVKLLEFGDDAVTVQMEGNPEPVKLFRE
jgi:uncharacterized Zn finger protein (UPF0148 family)